MNINTNIPPNHAGQLSIIASNNNMREQAAKIPILNLISPFLFIFSPQIFFL